MISGLDRNGLRPARWVITPDIVLVASEAGIVPEEEIRAEATGQLGPGEIIVVNLETGTHTFSAEVKRSLASRAPYPEWIRTQTNYVQDPFDERADDRFDDDDAFDAGGHLQGIVLHIFTGTSKDGMQQFLFRGQGDYSWSASTTIDPLFDLHKPSRQVGNQGSGPIEASLPSWNAEFPSTVAGH